MIELERQNDVFVLTMADGENRWNTTFTRELAKAFDEIEASEGPAALVTTSAHEKFYSNGLDLDWIMSKDTDHPGGDRRVFADEFMELMARWMTLGMPTIAAVNGHGFGAGFMFALSHDVRIMREDRGFLCANEIELGMTIPAAELALFRQKIPAPHYNETVMLAKRWTGPAAQEAGFVSESTPAELVMEAALDRAASLAHIGAHRENMKWQKEQVYGQNAAIQQPHGAAHLLRNNREYPQGPATSPKSD